MFFSKKILIIFILSFISMACAKKIDSQEISEAFVAKFHLGIKEGRYSEIYSNFPDELKSTLTQEDFEKAMKKTSSIMGDVVESRFVSLAQEKVNTGNSVSTAQFKTVFENGIGDEFFSLEIKDGNSTLFRYEINSDYLMTHMIEN